MEKQGAGGGDRAPVTLLTLRPLRPCTPAPGHSRPCTPPGSTPRQTASSGRRSSSLWPPCMAPQLSAVTAVGLQLPRPGLERCRLWVSCNSPHSHPSQPGPTSCLTTEPSAVPGWTQCQGQVTQTGEDRGAPSAPTETVQHLSPRSGSIHVPAGGRGHQPGTDGWGEKAGC